MYIYIFKLPNTMYVLLSKFHNFSTFLFFVSLGLVMKKKKNNFYCVSNKIVKTPRVWHTKYYKTHKIYI